MKKQIAIIMVLLVTIFSGFGIIIPVMPEMVKNADAAPVHLGLLLAVYSAVSFLLSPFWGALSDRIGRRPILLIGTIGFALSFWLFGISGENLWLMYASRILGGLFSGATTSCAVAYVADITDENNRTKGMGFVGMSIGLGFIFGPAIGGMLSGYGHEVPFYVAAGLAVLMFVFVLRMLPESLTVDKRTLKSERNPSRWTAFSGNVKYLYILGFLVSFTLAGLESTLQYFQMVAYGATPRDFGYMLFISGIAGALIQGGVVRRIRKGAESAYIQLGLILSAIGFILLLFSNSFWTATAYLTVFACGNALLRSCVTSLITQKTTVGTGVASGLSSSMDSLGRIAGPLLATAAYNFMHIRSPFIMGAIFCLLGIVILYRFMQLDKKRLIPTAG